MVYSKERYSATTHSHYLKKFLSFHKFSVMLFEKGSLEAINIFASSLITVFDLQHCGKMGCFIKKHLKRVSLERILLRSGCHWMANVRQWFVSKIRWRFFRSISLLICSTRQFFLCEWDWEACLESLNLLLSKIHLVTEFRGVDKSKVLTKTWISVLRSD